jgi:LacI family transcriptional regulator
MTVSRALRGLPGVSEPRREEIRRLAEELGYVVPRPEPRPSGGRSRLVGVIAPYLDHSYSQEVMAGIHRGAREAGYEVVVCSPEERVRTPSGGIVRLLERSAAGVIALVPYVFDYPSAAPVGRIPIVTIDHGGDHPWYPSVAGDSYQGACAAVRHLLELGHRRIAFIAGVERLASARERHRAWVDTLTQHRLTPDEALVATGRFTRHGGLEAATHLLASRPRPTAIFAANDLSAIGALAAAEAAGLSVPRDLSIVGFDDAAEALQVQPQLTTIRQPIQDLGRVAFEMLLALMQGKRIDSVERLLPTELVVRGSTGPPPREERRAVPGGPRRRGSRLRASGGGPGGAAPTRG